MFTCWIVDLRYVVMLPKCVVLRTGFVLICVAFKLSTAFESYSKYASATLGGYRLN